MQNSIKVDILNSSWSPWISYFIDNSLLSYHSYYISDEERKKNPKFLIPSDNSKIEELFSMASYRVIEETFDEETGFAAKLYYKHGEYTLAIRGTEFPREIIDDVVRADILGLASGTIPYAQTESMIKFINKLQSEGYHNMNITGHSLGGALAQIASKMYPGMFKYAFVYNAPSAKDLYSDEVFIDYDSDNPEKYFYKKIYSDETNSWVKSYIPLEIGKSYYNYQNTDMTTLIFNISGRNSISPIADLHNKDRFGYDIDVVGDTHSIVDMTKILQLYEFADRIDEAEIFYHTYGKFGKMSFVEIVENLIFDIENTLNLSQYDNDMLKILLDYKNNNIDFTKTLHQSLYSEDFASGAYSIINNKSYTIKIPDHILDDFKETLDQYSLKHLGLLADYNRDILYPEKMFYPDTHFINLNNLNNSNRLDERDEFTKSEEVILGTMNDDDVKCQENGYGTEICNVFTLAGDDNIRGGKYNHYIEAGYGNDIIDLRKSEGKNIVYGDLVEPSKINAGDDIFYSGKGEDELHGDYGFDTYHVRGKGHKIYDTDGLGAVFFNGRKVWADPNFKSEWIDTEYGEKIEHIISGIKPTFNITHSIGTDDYYVYDLLNKDEYGHEQRLDINISLAGIGTLDMGKINIV